MSKRQISDPLVSVLMPVFNGEKFLREAVESIINQSYKHFEFIIIDDGSTDATWRILNSFSDSRIRLYRNDYNQGLISSLNMGLNLSNGKFIGRMDADDISISKRLEKQVSYLENHPKVGLVSTNFCLIDESGRQLGKPLLTGSYNRARIIWDLFWGNPIAHPSVMYRLDLVKQFGGYSQNFRFYAEDYALWWSLIDVQDLGVIEECLLLLRKHESNVTILEKSDHVSELIQVAQTALEKRVGYCPSGRHLRLVRHFPVTNPLTIEDYCGAITILVNAYSWLTRQCELNRMDVTLVEKDLNRRLMNILGRFSKQSEIKLSLLLFRLVERRPRLLLSWANIVVMIKISFLSFRLRNLARVP